MKKYRKLQIIKHALEHYIKREGTTQLEIKEEVEILKQITAQVEQIKEQYHINSKRYQVTYETEEIGEFECSSKKTAKRKAFNCYKENYPSVEYNDFLQKAIVHHIE